MYLLWGGGAFLIYSFIRRGSKTALPGYTSPTSVSSFAVLRMKKKEMDDAA